MPVSIGAREHGLYGHPLVVVLDPSRRRIEGAETGIVLSCKQLVDATGEVALGTRQLENGL